MNSSKDNFAYEADLPPRVEQSAPAIARQPQANHPPPPPPPPVSAPPPGYYGPGPAPETWYIGGPYGADDNLRMPAMVMAGIGFFCGLFVFSIPALIFAFIPECGSYRRHPAMGRTNHTFYIISIVLSVLSIISGIIIIVAVSVVSLTVVVEMAEVFVNASRIHGNFTSD